MPTTVSDLKKHMADSQHAGDLPTDSYRNIVAGLVGPTFRPLQDILRAQEAKSASIGNAALRATGERMRAEADARQATIDARDLAIQHREALQRLREESDAASRKARMYFWWSIAASVLVAALSVLVGWLLTH
jgi:hypothetical protein